MVVKGDVVVYRIASEHYRTRTLDFVRDALRPLVSGKGAQLVLVGDSPKLKERATYCLPSRFAPHALERCDTPIAEARDATVESALQTIAQVRNLPP